MRNRKEADWYSSDMEKFLSERLYNDNKPYNNYNKLKVNCEVKARRIIKYFIRFVLKIKQKLWK
ncbi:MAG: hypothetical protein LBG92_05540 [Prevotellaceae bacterium]|nr:hypothetical protein [Prevotellaceae bacterium]